MSSLASPEFAPEIKRPRQRPGPRTRLNKFDLRANRALKWLALGAGVLLFFVLIAIAYQVISGASPAINRYGLGFLGHKWNASANQYGAVELIFGTLVIGVGSVILATALGVAIGLFLSLMAPRQLAAIVGPLIEMLAAIPSVVLGLIGIYLICPFLAADVEPALHSAFGFIPIFAEPQPVGNSLFAAILVLTIMVLPIVAALSRDVFLTVPSELRDGAEALGATRWEMIRGVVIPTTYSGVIAACMLGFGRATGEAIAVAQVIGGTPRITSHLFLGSDALAPLLAVQYPTPISAMQTASMFYLALILLVLGLATNLTAQSIARRHGGGR
ncbi:MAG: phosphate ABC transporter permease subunit PstC [Acidobacteriota bacterium]|nr:phosphate ABC transporter permease subunit PstC [Acidobacteriota bacterium]